MIICDRCGRGGDIHIYCFGQAATNFPGLNRNSRWDYISSKRYDCWFYAWDKCEQKCLKKAKEYR